MAVLAPALSGITAAGVAQTIGTLATIATTISGLVQSGKDPKIPKAPTPFKLADPGLQGELAEAKERDRRRRRLALGRPGTIVGGQPNSAGSGLVTNTGSQSLGSG